jgi:hypothetical protein
MRNKWDSIWQAELHKQLNIHYPDEIERLSQAQKKIFYLTEPLKVLCYLTVDFAKAASQNGTVFA